MNSASDQTEHFVQLYGADEGALVKNVGLYFASGLKHGGTGVIIATASHTMSFLQEIEASGMDAGAAQDEGRLICLDAAEMLNRFMRDGLPDPVWFDRSIGAEVRRMRERVGHSGMRAYGEMVGLLWSRGYFAGAFRLEALWNLLIQSAGFRLFCGYAIDVFGEEFETCSVEALLCNHSHMVSTAMNGDLSRALDLALQDTLGREYPAVSERIRKNRGPANIPEAESAILWLRNNLWGDASAILHRAREHYRLMSRVTA